MTKSNVKNKLFMKKIKIISLCVLGAIVASCGTSSDVVSGRLITKRKVNKGFHINSSSNAKSKGDDATMTKRAEFIQYTEEEVVVANTNESVANVVSNVELKENSVISNDAVINENTKTSVLTEKDVVTNNNNTVKSANKISNLEKKVIKAAAKKADKNSNSPMAAMDQELLILLVLWFFLGFLAGHRWYAGKPVGWNILFILTAGGCGIWAIVDLVNIIKGDFK